MSVSHDQQRRSVAWDIVTGPRNYLTLIATQVISSLAALGTVWLLTRSLSVGGYGQVAAIIAAAFLIGTAALNWSAMSLTRIGCEEFIQTGFLTETFWTRTFILGLSWLLVLATVPLWLPVVSDWLHLNQQAQVLLFIYLGAVSLWGHVQSALWAAKLQALTGRLQTLERLLILAGAASLFMSGGSIPAVIAIYATGSLSASLLGLWHVRHLIGRPPLLNASLLGRLLVFSLPLVPQSLVSYFSTNYLDAWFILRYLTVADLGVYAIAYQLAGTAMQLPVLTNSLLLPWFTTLEVRGEDQDRQLNEYMRRLLPVLSLGWTLVATVIAGVAIILLPLVFGQQFAAAAQLMWPLMAACAIAGPMSMGYGPLLNAKSSTSAIALSALAGATMNVLLNLALIPRWGLLGCAWATVMAYLVNLLVGAYLLWRQHGLSGGWTIGMVMPLLGGAAFAAVTGNNPGAFLIAVVLLFCHGLIHRTMLLSAGKRFYQLWARKPVPAALPVL